MRRSMSMYLWMGLCFGKGCVGSSEPQGHAACVSVYTPTQKQIQSPVLSKVKGESSTLLHSQL